MGKISLEKKQVKKAGSKMKIIKVLYELKNKLLNSPKKLSKNYYRKYKKYSFTQSKCKNERQYEASITKLYHSVEKGLSYINYKPGFGKENVNILILELKKHSQLYGTSAFFYQTALCVLNEYINKNKEYGHNDVELEKKIKMLNGSANECGGILEFAPYDSESNFFDYEKFVKSRHSVRFFSENPVDESKIDKAIELAQYTPSACNRQGWMARVISNNDVKKAILANQNGNRGFGSKITNLIVVTGDLRCFSSSRELHQVFIDGGMYAMNILHALHANGIASIPLSASLTSQQEKNVRKIAKIDDFEVLIMFIGVGNFPQRCVTTKSARRPCEIIKL